MCGYLVTTAVALLLRFTLPQIRTGCAAAIFPDMVQNDIPMLQNNPAECGLELYSPFQVPWREFSFRECARPVRLLSFCSACMKLQESLYMDKLPSSI